MTIKRIGSLSANDIQGCLQLGLHSNYRAKKCECGAQFVVKQHNHIEQGLLPSYGVSFTAVPCACGRRLPFFSNDELVLFVPR